MTSQPRTNPIVSGGDKMRRRVVGIVLPLIGLGVAVTAMAATDLPDPVASHWSPSGSPDGSVGRTTFFVLFVGLITLAGLAAFYTSRRPEVRRGDLSAPVGLSTFMQWVFVGVVVATAWANDGASEWADAGEISLPLALLIPVAAAVIATAAAWVVRPVGEVVEARGADAPTVGRAPGERLAWTSHADARWPLTLAGAMALVGTVLFISVDPVVGIVMYASAAIVALFGWIHVSADRRGLTVRYGPFGWPRTRIDLDRIEQATVIDVEPSRHGGWGYRGSVRVFGRAAVVVRAGEGIRLDLRGDKRFTVTVDDAATGAGTINDLIGATGD